MGRFQLSPLLLTLASAACFAGVDVADGFETPSLSKLWSTKRFTPGAAVMQSEFVRAGQGAVRITLREGDWTEVNDYPGGPTLERAELEEARELWAVEERTYRYAFSVRLPKDFPIVPTRLVIAQWKQKCPRESCSPSSPLIAIRYSEGELRVTGGPDGRVLYSSREEIRDRWLDFQFQLRFAGGERGQIQAWLGGRQVVDYRGTTTYPEAGGYSSRKQFYFKIGLYRDRMHEPMAIYVDEYRKQELIPGQ